MRKGVQIFNVFFLAVMFSGKTFTLFDVKVARLGKRSFRSFQMNIQMKLQKNEG